MSEDWTAMQKRGAELNLFERGDTKESLMAKLAEYDENASKGGDPRQKELARRDGGRISYGGFSLNLDVPPHLLDEANYFHRWFTEPELQRAYQAGFMHVMRDGSSYDPKNKDHRRDDQWYTFTKGRDRNNKSQVNFLLRQPREFYEEDQALKRQHIESVEKAFLDDTQAKSNPNFYVPGSDSVAGQHSKFTRD